MSFKSAVLNTPVIARTENGMKALESTLNAPVDLFFQIGASRGKDITPLLLKSYLEDRETTLRIIQWARDVRGGAGERELFRQSLKWLEKNSKSDLTNTRLLANISEIGRWDDLLIFEDAEIKSAAFTLIQSALWASNGLCAKWMPRKGKLAAELRSFMSLSPKAYRKLLVNLTKVVETQMCAKEFDQINFSHVPSLAMSRYSKAFAKKAPEQFTAYKEALQKGSPDVKVNAGAVYPYDVLKNVRNGDSALANEQWKALPNYVGDAMVLPMVDVSGSMCCAAGNGEVKMTCLDIAISLGLYLADKNTGAFKDLFLTFSSTPKFEHLKGTLSQKLQQMRSSHWGMSTNLESAFKEILHVAVTNRVSPSDMPKVLLILSDMQFNQAARYDDSAIEMIRRKYEDAGYEVPGIVFWNLNSRDNAPVRFDERGTALVSGFSPSIMKAVLASDTSQMTPQGIMSTAIQSHRYDI